MYVYINVQFKTWTSIKSYLGYTDSLIINQLQNTT